MAYNILKQHARFKLHAIERLNLLLDKGSFCEIGKEVAEHGGTYRDSEFPYDGVITGYGYIKKQLVFVYAQDFTICGGTVGLKHAEKIVKIIELAIENKAPVIGINDSGGARIQEGVNALAGYGKIFYSNTLASGYIPQISIISGPCAGGAVYSPGITDFIFITRNIGTMYVTGPKVLEHVTGMKCSADNLGGADVHSRSGVAHFIHDSEKESFESVRSLISLLPANCEDHLPMVTRYIPKKGRIKNISQIVPDDSKKAYDMHDIIDMIIDEHSFMEVHQYFAANIIVGFARLSDITIGIVANNPASAAGVLDCDASDKAARFIRFCDCFHIPIVTLVDAPGFMPSVKEEEKGIIRHGAKMLFAYSEATAVKVTIIIRKAYGGAYIAMGSRHLKADMVYCWPNAEVAVMGEESAVEILFHKQIAERTGKEKDDYIKKRCEEYRYKYINSRAALKEGYIDGVIEPDDTRSIIFNTLIAFSNKSLLRCLPKKHNNIPL